MPPSNEGITTLLLRERSETGTISLKAFYLRRTLQIFPLYYGMLGLYVILVLLLERHSEAGAQFWRNLPFFATYTSNWFVPLTSDRIIFFFAWSLATEEQFYLFWPWVIRKGGVILPVAVMVVLLILQDAALGSQGTSLAVTVLASISPYICAGSLAAIALHNAASFRWAWRVIGWPGTGDLPQGGTSDSDFRVLHLPFARLARRSISGILSRTIERSGRKSTMNNTVYYNSAASDDVRRQHLYDGQLFVFATRRTILNFVDFARDMLEDAFGGLDPRIAQDSMDVKTYADLLGKLKPAFIHHPESKRHLTAILEDLGCDLGKTYFDVPRMRSSTSSNDLTTGIAYAWHAYRDTWYSAPPCQLNWWLPIYELHSDNAMAFHPRYWSEPVKNSSAGYNYYTWNKLHRGENVAKLVKEDPRPLPRATEPMELDPQIRLICPVGGLVLFSAAQMHSSVPNISGVTRFSIDFRTVHLDDVIERNGAPNLDAACTGTVLRDFMRGTDLTRLPEDVVGMYDDGTAVDGELIYMPKSA